jgi:hypothetical protein
MVWCWKTSNLALGFKMKNNISQQINMSVKILWSCPLLSYTHRSMGICHNQTFALVASDSARPIQYSVSDIRVVFASGPTPCSCSSFSHAHRSMGFCRNLNSEFCILLFSGFDSGLNNKSTLERDTRWPSNVFDHRKSGVFSRFKILLRSRIGKK